METMAKTGERVRSSSFPSRNQKIDQEIVSNIAHYSEQECSGNESTIKSWTGTLEGNAGLLGLTGAILALAVDKRWAILPAVVTSFLVQHAIQGWCLAIAAVH